MNYRPNESTPSELKEAIMNKKTAIQFNDLLTACIILENKKCLLKESTERNQKTLKTDIFVPRWRCGFK